MKILTNSLTGVYINVIQKLRKEYGIEALYVIQFEQKLSELLHSSLKGIIKEKFMYLDMLNARYKGYIFYDEIPPLDKEILDKMAAYEPEVMKMMETVDRVYDMAEKRFIMYHQHVRYWNYFLDKIKVDLFISFATPHAVYDYIIMRLCQMKNIPVLQMERMPFQFTHRLMVYKDYEAFDEEIKIRIREYNEKYQAATEVDLPKDLETEYLEFVKSKGQIVPVIRKRKLIQALRQRAWLFRQIWKTDEKNAVLRTIKHFSGKKNIAKLLRYYEKLAVSADYSVPYIYFPLHYQPELTTSPRGGWFVHQYLAIEMLSYHAPKGVWIYVKEHPALKKQFFQTRIKEHYRKISQLSNVRLISLNDNTIPLMEHAVAVASITGSVGYEALYKKKPYFMFGNQVMKYSPNTINIRTNRDCSLAMKRVFKEGFCISDRDIRIFMKVIGEVTVEIEEDKSTRKELKTKKNIQSITGCYKKIFDEIKGKNKEEI